MYSSFLLIIISVFTFSFNSLTGHPKKKKKITMSDFYQEVTFKQYSFLPHPAVYVLVC